MKTQRSVIRNEKQELKLRT